MKYLLLTAIICPFFVSCSKSAGTTSRVLVCNAGYSQTSLTASWDGYAFLSTGLAQGQVSGKPDSPYARVAAGTNNIVLKLGTTVLLDKNIYASPTGGYSVVLYDTNAMAVSNRVLVLTDDLTRPDTFSIRFRILDCVPTQDSVDIWLVNQTQADSIRLDSAAAYIGSTVLEENIQSFAPAKYYGGAYTVKIKKTGTEQVLATLSNYPFNIQEIYSIVYSGIPAGSGASGLKITVFRHPQQ
jgi:hypothetical protein